MTSCHLTLQSPRSHYDTSLFRYSDPFLWYCRKENVSDFSSFGQSDLPNSIGTAYDANCLDLVPVCLFCRKQSHARRCHLAAVFIFHGSP